MKKLVVETDKLKNNLTAIKEAAHDAELFAVLKANAYGLGLVELAEFLRGQGVRRFAVSDPVDAQTLRDAGIGDEEILVLRSTACEQDVRTVLAACATATVGSYDAAVALNGIAESEGAVCDVHIEIDTGMGRYGFDPTEVERIVSVFRYMTSLNIVGMYTHFSNAFRSKKLTRAQYDLFMNTVQAVRNAGYNPGMLHACNSSALFYCGLPDLDAVRIGSALGGRLTARGSYPLQKTGRLECPIVEVRWLPKGRGVGYGACYKTKRATQIAVIPVGTSDGFMVEKARDSFRLRECLRYGASGLLSFFRKRRPHVLIKGRRATVLGHVGVSHTTVDVTDIGCQPGEMASIELSPIFVPAHIEREYV